MPRALWPLVRGRPVVQVVLKSLTQGTLVRTLLADTGAGAITVRFDMMLDERDCLLCGGVPAPTVSLRGAYQGLFPVYAVRVQIPALALDDVVRAVGISRVPRDFDGIAAFPFLNRFTYGNFGDSGQFGLEN